jgi:hypothetical protein
MQTRRRTPLRVIAVTRVPVATVSTLTSRNGLRSVPNELTTPSQPFKARMRVPSSRASPSIMSTPGRSALAFERTRATTEWPFARASRTISPVPKEPG